MLHLRLLLWLPVVVLLLCCITTPPCVDASVLNLIFDWRGVCDPNFKVCPNNGLAFRDRNKDCQFPPCELVTPGPPKPPPTDRDTLEVSKWFGKREFAVPVLNMSVIKKGRRVQQKWLESLRLKTAQAMSESQGAVQAAIDVYVVPKPPTDVALALKIHPANLHVGSIIVSTGVAAAPSPNTTQPASPNATQPASSSTPAPSSSAPPAPPDSKPGYMYDENLASLFVEPSNAVSHPPWSHWELYGQIANGVVTNASVQAAVELLRLRVQNETVMNNTVIPPSSRPLASLVAEAATNSSLKQDTGVMTTLLMQCENLTRSTEPETAVARASVRVFLTDLRGYDGSQELQSSWNLTRVACGQSIGVNATVAASSSSSGSGSYAGSSSLVVLHRPEGDLPSTNSCSCWTRSLEATGIVAGYVDDGDEEESTEKTTWMLCA